MFATFALTSPEPVSAVRARIAATLTTERPVLWDAPTTFHGRVTDAGFRVVRNLALHARTMPIVATGGFAPSADGTTIQVRTRPQWWVVLAVAAWSVFWVELLWRRVVSDPLPGGVHLGEVGLILGFVAFGWGLMLVVWAVEARWYRESLAQTLAETVPVVRHYAIGTPVVERAPHPRGSSCPRCGATLPPARDAFCTECRGPLDEREG
jgi:hypothetical protein